MHHQQEERDEAEAPNGRHSPNHISSQQPVSIWSKKCSTTEKQMNPKLSWLVETLADRVKARRPPAHWAQSFHCTVAAATKWTAPATMEKVRESQDNASMERNGARNRRRCHWLLETRDGFRRRILEHPPTGSSANARQGASSRAPPHPHTPAAASRPRSEASR